MGDICLTKLHSKDAKLSLKLKADSGFSSVSEYRVSPQQWSEVIAVCEDGPALQVMRAAPDLLLGLQRIFNKMDRGEGAPGHSHDVPGIWDADNGPSVAGTRCEWCAQWEEARAAFAKSTQQEASR